MLVVVTAGPGGGAAMPGGAKPNGVPGADLDAAVTSVFETFASAPAPQELQKRCLGDIGARHLEQEVIAAHTIQKDTTDSRRKPCLRHYNLEQANA